jgi:hypothetical protein
MGATLLADWVGFTVTVAVPNLVGSWVDVAVTVTFVVEETTGAVSRPADEIWPTLAAQVTVEAKFPVPITVAEHWLVWPDWTVEGEHDAVTDVIVVVGLLLLLLLLPPPQATISATFPIASKTPSFRTTLLLQRISLA